MTTGVKDLLSKEEIQQLTERSDRLGWWWITRTWLLIGFSFAVLAMFPHPLTFLLVVVILGGQQLCCAVLTHEAAHRTLFRTRRLNETVADWLCARPIWTDVERYRQHHIRHHAHTGTGQDPDMSLVEPFPTTRRSMFRRFMRDLLGLTGIRRVFGLFLMDIGVLKYTVAADVERLPRNGRRLRDYARAGVLNMTPMLLSNIVLAGLLAACGVLWVYSAWVVAYLTTFSLFIRIRSIAEHACTEKTTDYLKNTRTTRAGWLARLTVAPMNVNYHIEHHLMASVPFHQLPALHRLLAERGAVQPAGGYLAVLKQASSAG